MAEPTLILPQPDAILTSPIWNEPVRVIRATKLDGAIRIEAVGIGDSKYYDRTVSFEQFEMQVREVVGGAHHFDASPRLFRLATEALRTHLAHVFDPQFAVSVSQVDPLPHQLDAVYRHMLPLPRVRFLLADDPGAGKTIMAGLLMRELMQRGDLRRVLVLCPKALTDQWRREMSEKFRERFTLVTGETVASAFGENTWVENDRIVASIDLAIQPHIQPGLEQARWDMIVVDEAHKLSAYRYGSGKIDKTQKYQLVEKLAQKTRHLLLMTATPHRGDDENFRLLLSLLDPKVFASMAGTRKALANRDQSPYFLRRMKEAMRHFDGRPLFLPRKVDTVPYPLTEHEQRLYDAVTDYVSTGLQQAESERNRNVGLALTVLQRRLASSLFAITRSLERRRERLANELDMARRTGKVGVVSIDIELDEDEDIEDLSPEDEQALSAASTAHSPQELEAEIALLDELIHLARWARSQGPEQKLAEFKRVIEAEAFMDGKEKLLVFTEHRDTLTYLTDKLREWGYSVCNIHGGMKLQDRIAAEKEFRGPAQIMVATDAAGEGINLQFCRVMINWDLPWNPNRLEQRMGRIHRYGQQFEVSVVNLVAETTREGAVLIRLMEKLRRMRDALGHDQVYDVISGVLDIGQVRLETLLREAILQRRSMDDILGDIEFVDSEAAKAAARNALGEALATNHIDMAFILGEDRESKERRLTPEYVERFFVDGFRHLGGRIATGKDRDWRLEAVPSEIRRVVQARNTGETGSAQRLLTFDKARARRDPAAEFIAPDHPLFDVVTDRLLEEGRPTLARGAVFQDPRSREPSLIWLLEAAVVNGEGDTVHRRLLALRQRGEQFEPISPGAILDLDPAGKSVPMPTNLRERADPEVAIAAASRFYADQYLAEMQAAQGRKVGIVQEALQRSVEDRLTELQERLERQLGDQERGKEMALAIRITNQEIDDLTSGLEVRRNALKRQTMLSIETPRVVGVAAVLPVDLPRPAAWGHGGGDQSAVERAAMEIALAHETAEGRDPVDVSREGVGYDIRSTGSDGEIRYIEVKGHAITGDVTLYYTEWQMAHRMRSEFYIYVVDHALSAPNLWIVRDPVGQGIEAREQVVQYHIRDEHLRVIAEFPDGEYSA